MYDFARVPTTPDNNGIEKYLQSFWAVKDAPNELNGVLIPGVNVQMNCYYPS